MKKRTILSLSLLLILMVGLVLPAHANDRLPRQQEAEPLALEKSYEQQITVHGALPALGTPSQEEIRAKWEAVTKASTVFLTSPSVSAPYATGTLSEDFLESGITYLNYVRFVAGLPEVMLDDSMNENAQYGAVLLAAIDELTHYPSRPGDMEVEFYEQGYSATSSSNISARWGYSDLTTTLKSAVLGCMNDNNSQSNLEKVGHRRWLLNPTLGKVGFGYAESETEWSYIVTKVFDRSGSGCDFDFIGWPVAGNHPTNLFDAQNPWSLTLSTSVYQTVSINTVTVTLTRESDGTQWSFDGSTGNPNIDNDGNIAPYLTVETSWYGIPNCIIFHPGTGNIGALQGTYQVDVGGIYLRDGTQAHLSYDVRFFEVNQNCTEHAYTASVTEPTCTEEGYTTFTCSHCGHSYVSDYTDPVDHVYEDGHCKWCGKAEVSEPTAKIISYSTSLGGNIAMNFYVELSDDLVSDPDAYIQFSFAGKTVEVPVSEGVPTGTSYRFACPITSKNMTDDITAQVYNANGPVGDSKTMAVDTYCNWIIANTSDQKTINLMKAMLNYGASAQMLFSYRTDDLANAALSAADKVFAKVDASAFAHSRVGEEDGIKPVSYTLLLDSETTVRCYFQLTGTKSIEEFTFTVDGIEVTPTYKDGYYYIEKANIAAHRLDDMHVFTCGNITITYGGMSYVNQVMTYYTSGTTFDMASALYAYSKAAEAYIG